MYSWYTWFASTRRVPNLVSVLWHGPAYAPPTEKRDELALKLRAEVVYDFTRTLPTIASHRRELSHVRLRLDVALVAVRVATRLVADLAVPPQAREPTRLHGIGNRLPASQPRRFAATHGVPASARPMTVYSQAPMVAIIDWRCDFASYGKRVGRKFCAPNGGSSSACIFASTAARNSCP